MVQCFFKVTQYACDEDVVIYVFEYCGNTKGGKGNNHIYTLVKGRHLDYLKQVMFYVDLERNYFYDQVR